VIWLLPFVCAFVGLTLLTVLASRVRGEVDPTRRSIDAFGRELRPVLLRVRDETRRTRRRFDD
jgi:hypothetical protein